LSEKSVWDVDAWGEGLVVGIIAMGLMGRRMIMR